MGRVFPSTLHNSDPSGQFVNCGPSAPAAQEVQLFCTRSEQLIWRLSNRWSPVEAMQFNAMVTVTACHWWTEYEHALKSLQPLKLGFF